MNIHCLDWSPPCVWMNMHICTHIAVFSTGAIRATRILYQSWWYYLYSWQVSTWQAWHHYRHHCSYHHPMITSGWFVRCKVGWCGVIWKKVVWSWWEWGLPESPYHIGHMGDFLHQVTPDQRLPQHMGNYSEGSSQRPNQWFFCMQSKQKITNVIAFPSFDEGWRLR